MYTVSNCCLSAYIDANTRAHSSCVCFRHCVRSGCGLQNIICISSAPSRHSASQFVLCVVCTFSHRYQPPLDIYTHIEMCVCVLFAWNLNATERWRSSAEGCKSSINHLTVSMRAARVHICAMGMMGPGVRSVAWVSKNVQCGRNV